VAAEDIVRLGNPHERGAPPTEILQQRSQRQAPFGEVEQRGRDRRRGFLAAHDSRLFHLAQTIGEQVCGDAGQALQQVGVPGRSRRHELADDQQDPTISDDVEGFGDCAVLLVRPHAR